MQDSRPEASFRALSLAAGPTTVSASATEQADSMGASGLQLQILPNVFFSQSFEKSGRQDPHLSLIAKLRSREKTGLCTCVSVSRASVLGSLKRSQTLA